MINCYETKLSLLKCAIFLFLRATLPINEFDKVILTYLTEHYHLLNVPMDKDFLLHRRRIETSTAVLDSYLFKMQWKDPQRQKTPNVEVRIRICTIDLIKSFVMLDPIAKHPNARH